MLAAYSSFPRKRESMSTQRQTDRWIPAFAGVMGFIVFSLVWFALTFEARASQDISLQENFKAHYEELVNADVSAVTAIPVVVLKVFRVPPETAEIWYARAEGEHTLAAEGIEWTVLHKQPYSQYGQNNPSASGCWEWTLEKSTEPLCWEWRDEAIGPHKTYSYVASAHAASGNTIETYSAVTITTGGANSAAANQTDNFVANYSGVEIGTQLMVFVPPKGTRTILFERAEGESGPWAEVAKVSYYHPPANSGQSDADYRQTSDASAKEGATYYYRATCLGENDNILEQSQPVRVVAKDD